MRIKLQIEYDGTDFCGWQLQANGRSVQGVLEAAAQAVFQRPVRIHGAGRTDSGVHARGQVAHADVETRLEPRVIRNALNAHLPPEVCIHGVEEVDPDFHARFSASSRAYEYAITQRRVAIGRQYAWLLHAALDGERIREAVDALPGMHDFTALSKRNEDVAHHRCLVFEARWMDDTDGSRFFMRANRFMYGMVRAIVAGLVDVGRGRRTPADFAALLASTDRRMTPALAPPHGLCLVDVRYDARERDIVTRGC